MGKDELGARSNWQTLSGANALSLEEHFLRTFEHEFSKPKNSAFRIRKRPKDFTNIYSNIPLSPKVVKNIYSPERNYSHGIAIDFAIDNVISNKTLYVEIKRQDGWVENLPSSAGRGNAHERLCKLFTPGLSRILHEKGGIEKPHLPFWAVFGGNITRDPKRVREITCWFAEHGDHFFMWRSEEDTKSIVSHFNNKLKKLLVV